MFTTDFITIDEYLEQNKVSSTELFRRAMRNEIELLLHLEEIEGSIDKEEKRITITSALCKLSKQQCEKLYSKSQDEVYINLFLELIEGTYRELVNEEHCGGWFKKKIDPNIGDKSLRFRPFVYNDSESHLNPSYKLIPCSKVTDGKSLFNVYCIAIPINKLLVKINLFGIFWQLNNRGHVCLDKIINLFWPQIEDNSMGRSIKNQAESAIKNGELKCKENKQVDGCYFVEPEQFLSWMIDKKLLPERALKYDVFRVLKRRNDYGKELLDDHKYVKLPKDEADNIFQSTKRGEIDIYLKIKVEHHFVDTGSDSMSKITRKYLSADKLILFCFEYLSIVKSDVNIYYLLYFLNEKVKAKEELDKYTETLHERREAYLKVIRKKIYWKLNDYDCYGNYITQLHQSGKINNSINNSVFLEQTDIEKELGICFCYDGQKHEITLDDVFVREEDLLQLKEESEKERHTPDKATSQGDIDKPKPLVEKPENQRNSKNVLKQDKNSAFFHFLYNGDSGREKYKGLMYIHKIIAHCKKASTTNSLDLSAFVCNCSDWLDLDKLRQSKAFIEEYQKETNFELSSFKKQPIKFLNAKKGENDKLLEKITMYLNQVKQKKFDELTDIVKDIIEDQDFYYITQNYEDEDEDENKVLTLACDIEELLKKEQEKLLSNNRAICDCVDNIGKEQKNATDNIKKQIDYFLIQSEFLKKYPEFHKHLKEHIQYNDGTYLYTSPTEWELF